MLRRIAVLTGLTAACAVLVLAPAQAAVVPIDPGPAAAGKPIVGTTQNLPPLDATSMYYAGSNVADLINGYFQSGTAARDQAAVAKAARTWVRSFIHRECDGKPKACKALVVFDVDDTLLSTYPQEAAGTPPFTSAYDAWLTASATCAQPAIKPVADAYRAIQRMGVKVAILTSRPASMRDETMACLRAAGVDNWAQFVTKVDANAQETSAVFKAKQRAAWERGGYTIVASIGDQVSDMSGGHLRHGFLLPNPMYLIP